MSRVLIIGNFLSAHSGHLHYCEELANKLEARSHSILRTSSFPDRVRKLADMMRTVLFRRKDYDVAIVDVFSGLAFVWAELVTAQLRALGKPYALVLHGGRLPQFAERWPGRVRHLLDRATVVASPSKYMAEALVSIATSIEVLPNALEISDYPYAPRKSVAPNVVWVRAFHDVYNPILAVRALAELRSRGTDATLTMVGADKDGSLATTKQLAASYGLGGLLQIIPGVPKRSVPAILAANDIFLNTARIDNTPISVLEAMACGLCVVSTNVGGISALLTDRKDAVLVPADDPCAMAGAIQELVGDVELASQISRNARATASAHDWSTVLGRWDALIERLGNA